MKMLSHIKSDWKGVAKEDKKTYWRRAREDVLDALEYLALYAEKMPADQLNQTFTSEKLQPLVRAILRPKTGIWRLKEGEGKKHEPNPDWEPCRERLADICKTMIDELSAVSGMVAPKATNILGRAQGQGQVESLQALLVGY